MHTLVQFDERFNIHKEHKENVLSFLSLEKRERDREEKRERERWSVRQSVSCALLTKTKKK
jgi:hypothetical protein